MWGPPLTIGPPGHKNPRSATGNAIGIPSQMMNTCYGKNRMKLTPYVYKSTSMALKIALGGKLFQQ